MIPKFWLWTNGQILLPLSELWSIVSVARAKGKKDGFLEDRTVCYTDTLSVYYVQVILQVLEVEYEQSDKNFCP